MKSKIMLRFLALFFLGSLATLSGQNESNVSLSIDLVAWGDEIGGLSLKSAGKGETTTALSFTYSDPVKYTGPALLEIHQKAGGGSTKLEQSISEEDALHQSIPLEFENEPEESANPEASKSPIVRELLKRREKEPTLVALVNLPTNARHVTILLAPAGQGTFKPYLINDDPSKLPPGKLRVHNLSPFPIGMRFSGKQSAELKPGKNAIFNAVNGQTVYELSYQGPKGWTVQENNIIPVRPTEQTQLIVLKSNNSFFLSSDGAAGGFLQLVTLRRPLN